jgi:zinc resistance-associated protein
MLKPGKLKPLLAGTALLALAGGSFVYAQQGLGYHGFGDAPRAEFRHGPSAADVAAFSDARIAALKAGLELTPDQTKNWPPFEQAMRDMVQSRIQRIQARDTDSEQHAASPFDRLARRADNMSKRSAALKKVADAGAPLYQSLNDEQKGRFIRLALILRPHPFMHGGWRNDGHGDGHGWQDDGRRFGQENGAGDTDQKTPL